MVRLEERRWGGMEYLARRLDERASSGSTSPLRRQPTCCGCSPFASFDSLYTGHGMTGDEVATTLTAIAERTLCRDVEPVTEA